MEITPQALPWISVDSEALTKYDKKKSRLRLREIRILSI